MDIDVGPVDPSVLYEQDLHVSSAVWEGQVFFLIPLLNFRF